MPETAWDCSTSWDASSEQMQIVRKNNWKGRKIISLSSLIISWLLRNTWSCMCGSEACFNFQEICASILVFIFSLGIPKVSSGAAVSGIGTFSLTSKIYLCWSSFCVKIVQCEIWNKKRKKSPSHLNCRGFVRWFFFFLVQLLLTSGSLSIITIARQ